MRFDVVNNTYCIKKTEYYGSKGTNLETITRKAVMTAIPEQSFAFRMCAVAKTWAEENKEMPDPAK